ncbi:TPA: hypothetical protein P0E24_002268 [Vibrio campbellii]|uniref:hypothetical protein n=1 Tax=Vibrio sp. M260121 TaxID=3020897 RepID=UPI002F419F0C|nr:hypothetical protein [Vibrio campbellii]HDM8243191.1 hypothetical protein [Vibrio campbellii]
MSGRRVAKNTLFQIIKMLITTVVNLYMVRVLLQQLGVDGYGIFNLIAGVLALMLFLNGAMTTSSQRYLSFYSTQNIEKRVSVFATTKALHVFVALIIFLLLFLLQSFVFKGLIKIPEPFFSSAQSLYQIMAFGVLASVVTVPFNAQINANEDLGVDAMFSVFESLFKLISAFLIILFENQLVALGTLFISVSWMMFIAKVVYCRIKYEECNFLNFKLDFALFKEMIGFTSWNSFGAICGVARVQGLAVLLNNFFGVYINAVYAIAVQVNGKLKEFSINIMKAFNPRIVKAESNGNREEMIHLSMLASRFSLLLYSVIALPIFFETDFMLSIWLGDYPEGVLTFIKLFLLLAFVNLTTVGLQTAIQATGDVKAYQSTIGSVLMLTLPLAYIFLSLGYPSYTVIVVSIFMEVVCCGMRLAFLKAKAGLSIKKYMIFVINKALQVLIPTIAILFLLTISFEKSILRFISTTLVSFGMISFLTYCLMLSVEEKKLMRLKV